jgi:hypothetical protein
MFWSWLTVSPWRVESFWYSMLQNAGRVRLSSILYLRLIVGFDYTNITICKDCIWDLLLVSTTRTQLFVKISLMVIPGDVFQAITVGKWVDIALVVSYWVLVLGCAQMKKSHVLSNIVSFVNKNVVSLADLTCMSSMRCVSSYHSWEMSGYCMTCVLFSVGAWVYWVVKSIQAVS